MQNNILIKKMGPKLYVIFDRFTHKTFLSKNRINQKDATLLLDGPDDDAHRQERFKAYTNFTTIVINVCESCNLRCQYCSRHKEKYSSKRTIDDQMLDTILEKAIDYSRQVGEKVVVQFHGGEPWLFFSKIKKCIEKQSKRDLSRLDLRIQTNGTLIDEASLKFCKKYNIHLGVSIDGPSKINEINRRFANGSSISSVLEKNLARIKELIPRNRISCLCVLSNGNVGKAKEVFKYVRDNRIDDLSILPLYPDFSACINDANDIVPRTLAMVDFSKEIFDLWVAALKSGEFVSMPNFQIWIWNFLGSNANYLTSNTSCGAGQSMLFIDVDGKIYPCGPFSYEKSMSFGNIQNIELRDIEQNSVFHRFDNRKVGMIYNCMDCALQGICLGGCPANSYRKFSDIYQKDPFCEYWEGIISHVIRRISEDLSLCELIPDFSIRL